MSKTYRLPVSTVQVAWWWYTTVDDRAEFLSERFDSTFWGLLFCSPRVIIKEIYEMELLYGKRTARASNCQLVASL